ncbi:LytR family transcriptional regulator [Micromonospora ureilytica]|uniref:LytR family transcriptional regulator n=1 Tax=Micromonospora ureilytica TaxID=709868 RepID=A0A3N9YD06_9ACTN|nr:LCP family protein [Micromonospora ureilytica]RQX17327.1 LytR family transcriptional regulator [Micromonospora ureilytica]
MIEDDLRATFVRHEPLIPSTGPLRVAIDRLAAVRRRRRQRFQAAGVTLALLAALGVGVPQLRPDPPVVGSLSSDRPAGAQSGALNVLLLGVDGFGEQPSYRLADSVLLVHIPADRSRPYLISLPRDLEVSIPGRGIEKLNSAFYSGAAEPRPDLDAGYDLTRRVVADLTGVRVDAGAVLTFAGLRRITEAVDGVEVCLPEEVRSWHTRRTFPAGCQRLDGAGAVDLLRQRRYLPDGAFDRDRNAQRYVAGLIRAAVARDVLSNPVRLTALLSAAGKGLAVDDDGLPLTRLVAVLPELKSVDPVGLSLPVGPPAGNASRLPLDPEQGPEFLAALRADRLAQWVAQHPGQVNPVR